MRATRVLAAAERRNRPLVDTVILDYAQRSSAQKIAVTGVKGGAFEIELHSPRGYAPTTCCCSTTVDWWKSWPRPSR